MAESGDIRDIATFDLILFVVNVVCLLGTPGTLGTYIIISLACLGHRGHWGHSIRICLLPCKRSLLAWDIGDIEDFFDVEVGGIGDEQGKDGWLGVEI